MQSLTIDHGYSPKVQLDFLYLKYMKYCLRNISLNEQVKRFDAIILPWDIIIKFTVIFKL
jgi:hypothetical protein